MHLEYLIIGIILLIYGVWSSINLYKQKKEDQTPFDVSVGIGTLFSLIGGIWLIVVSFS
ncbi:MAG: hypothetical protein AAGI25_11460 [Bacteroidota bacterium]